MSRFKEYNVFVSYSHADDDARAIIVDALEAAGFEVWWDAKLRSGNYRNQLRAKISNSDVVIAIWSHNADARPDEVIFEMTQAFSRKTLLPIRIDGAPIPKVFSQEHFMDFNEWKNDGEQRSRQIDLIIREVQTFSSVPVPCAAAPKPSHVSVHFSEGFPGAPRRLIGRDSEMQDLRDAWVNPASNAVVLHALGGAGKSALLRAFANERLENSGDGASRIYGWSAYSQGSGDQKRTDTDGFIATALDWFGYTGKPIRDSVERALILAELIQQQKTLLLLDGLEPLQHPVGLNNGKLKDRSLATLIKALGNFNPGLLIITSRQPIFELKGMGKLVVNKTLNRLSMSAGADLLVDLGVVGRQRHLEDAVREVNGHALSVTLLGTFIAEVCRGDIRRRKQFLLGRIIDTPEELDSADETQIASKRTRKFIEGYIKQFENLSGKAAGNGGPERALLNLLGLFDRPADGKAVDMLLSECINGLTDDLFFDAVVTREGILGLGRRVKLRKITSRERGQRIRRALERLRKLRLLDKTDFDDPRKLNAHPIVRAYFSEKISKTAPNATRLAHGKLYSHYIAPGPEYPETLAAMQPLLNAVGHGVRAGYVQEAFSEVFKRRLLRGHNHLGRALGAHETVLAAASEFYIKPWAVPHPDLPPGTKAWLLNLSATALMSVGRLNDAIEPREVGLEIYKNQKNWRRAAYSASRLSTTLLITGKINRAIKVAEKAIEYAEKSRDFEQRVLRRSELAAALNAAGDLPSAMQLITQAEDLLKNQDAYTGTRQLYSLPGYRYGYLLIRKGEYDEALLRGRHLLDKANELQKDGSGLQDIGFGWLLIGRAHDAFNDPNRYSEASEALDNAVECMRKADAEQYIPPTLIARAKHRRHRFMNGEADIIDLIHNDLKQAEDIASPEMKLYLADIALERAYLATTKEFEYNESHEYKAPKQIQSAAVIIRETGYRCRDDDLRELRKMID